MEKHTAYFNLLEQLDDPACPICNQLEASLKNFLDTYLYEGVTDRLNWNKLVASDGYCGRHSSMLESFSDGLAVAVFYRFLIRERLKALGKKEKGGSFFNKKKKQNCPACDYEEDTEKVQALLMAQALEEAEFKEKFVKHPGLCLAHARLVAQHEGAGKEMSARQLEKICVELDEFVRKSDHRSEEKMGTEGDSWRRALKKFHGIRYGRNWKT